MTRGTTPTYTFALEDETIDLSLAETVYVTFRQGRRAIRKTGDDITVSGYTVTAALTQEDSLLFSQENEPLLAQVNWVFDDGTRSASEIVRLDVLDTLEPEVLS